MIYRQPSWMLQVEWMDDSIACVYRSFTRRRKGNDHVPWIEGRLTANHGDAPQNKVRHSLSVGYGLGLSALPYSLLKPLGFASSLPSGEKSQTEHY